MFGIGPMEMVIVGIIALLLFGKRLPEVAKSLGKSFVEFKKGVQGIEDDVRETARAPVVSSSSQSTSLPQSRPAATDEPAEPAVPKFEAPKF
jgi:sec-independent protein translocase protein TatA